MKNSAVLDFSIVDFSPEDVVLTVVGRMTSDRRSPGVTRDEVVEYLDGRCAGHHIGWEAYKHGLQMIGARLLTQLRKRHLLAATTAVSRDDWRYRLGNPRGRVRFAALEACWQDPLPQGAYLRLLHRRGELPFTRLQRSVLLAVGLFNACGVQPERSMLLAVFRSLPKAGPEFTQAGRLGPTLSHLGKLGYLVNMGAGNLGRYQLDNTIAPVLPPPPAGVNEMQGVCAAIGILRQELDKLQADFLRGIGKMLKKSGRIQ